VVIFAPPLLVGLFSQIWTRVGHRRKSDSQLGAMPGLEQVAG
jgi:hypothetical protein